MITTEQKKIYMKKWRSENQDKLREYSRNFRKNNQEKVKSYTKKSYYNPETARRRTKKLQILFYDYKQSRGCYHCGETNPLVLCFHHKDPDSKKLELNIKYITNPNFWEEIDKCICLCHNCHHLEHLTQL